MADERNRRESRRDERRERRSREASRNHARPTRSTRTRSDDTRLTRSRDARLTRPTRSGTRSRSASRRPRRRRRAPGEQSYLARIASALIIFVTVFAALIMFFRVKIVRINGAHRYSDATILQVAGISDGQNMFLFDKYKMADRLIEELTYLEDAHISRDFPDTLIIDLKECVLPLAAAQDDACWLISPRGKVLDRLDASSASQYAQITGCPILSPSVGTTIALPSDYAAQQRSLIALLTALEDAQMLDDVDGIRLERHDCILMDYGGRFTVKFPLDANYPYKLHALETYIASDKIQDNMSGTFDLTRDDRNYFQPNAR